MPEPQDFHNRMQGRRVLVTGAGTQGEGVGTGKAISLLMAAEGARVALLDLHAERAGQTRELIRERGGEAEVFSGDVTVPADCQRMVDEAVAWLGGLDVLVNNVGVGAGTGRLEDMGVEVFRASLDINLSSAFFMSKAAIPALMAGDGKAIVNIASIAGMRAHGAVGYGSAKAALIQFTSELAVIYGRDGLRVNAIAPGHIYTPLVAGYAEAREIRRKIGPLGVEGDAWDIAQAALFLAGNEARFITGICLPVDGGVTAVGPWTAVGLAGS